MKLYRAAVYLKMFGNKPSVNKKRNFIISVFKILDLIEIIMQNNKALCP